MAIQIEGDVGEEDSAGDEPELADGDAPRPIAAAVKLAAVPFLGVALGLLMWTAIARFVISDSRLLASPWQVGQDIQEHWSFYLRNTRTTAVRSLQGLFVGVSLAVVASLVVAVILEIQRLSQRVATTVFAIPVIALAPVVRVIFEDRSPVALAAFAAFFVVFLALLVGLTSVDANLIDLIRALGGGRIRLLRKAKIPAAVPSFFAGLRVAIPISVLSVVIIESLGADAGLGVAIIGAMSALDSARAWGVGVMASAITLLGYAMNTALASWITPRFQANVDAR